MLHEERISFVPVQKEKVTLVGEIQQLLKHFISLVNFKENHHSVLLFKSQIKLFNRERES